VDVWKSQEHDQCGGNARRKRRGKKFEMLTKHFCSDLQVVIVQPNDAGSKSHPFSYAIVAGIERYPLKVTRGMGKKLVDRRSRIKPFIKVVNYNHLMPTRYTLELEGLKGTVTNDTFKEVSQREDAKKTIKKALEDRYTSGKNRWFFTALRTFGPKFSYTLYLESNTNPLEQVSKRFTWAFCRFERTGLGEGEVEKPSSTFGPCEHGMGKHIPWLETDSGMYR
jgi:large subunit ribosomal protein L27e